MLFLLEDNDELETYQMKLILEHDRVDTYKFVNDFNDFSSDKLKNIVPIGNLDFVKGFLNKAYGSSKMPPIEIPDILIYPEIVKREYKIISGDKVPKDGRYFIKDASEVKQFSFNGDIAYVQDLINMDHDYVLSSIVDILSEYRVIVLNDKIQAVQHYDGNPIIFPDINFIQMVASKYMRDSKRPKSYIADFGVSSNNDTFLIELQPSVSFGTYGYYDNNLKYVYKFGIDYYIDINK